MAGHPNKGVHPGGDILSMNAFFIFRFREFDIE